MQADRHENNNLALNPEQYRELIEKLNTRMNALVEAEIGEDIGQALPYSDQVSFALDYFDP